MVHVHGRRVQQLVEPLRKIPPEQVIAVSVDAGKTTAVALVADFTGERLCRPFQFRLNRSGIAELVARVGSATEDRPARLVRVGVEASGYHLPLVAPGVLPSAWEAVEFNPAHVAEQRKTNGKRGVKTDVVDATAMFDLLVAGRGSPVNPVGPALIELAAWARYRRSRAALGRDVTRHLVSLLDRAFPGLTGCLHRVMVTRVGRLVVTDFCDPARLARLGVTRFRRYAATRGLRVTTAVAERLVGAAREALPAADAAVAREAIGWDLALLAEINRQVAHAGEQLARLLPETPYTVLTTVPGWATIRAASYGGAVGDPSRWATAAQVYRASGLTPAVHESAGRRVDGEISREGSVGLRWALLELALGLRHHDRAARAYAARLADRGKHSMIIWTALANRANRIAFAMVRDQTVYDPACWR
jgi:transposase